MSPVSTASSPNEKFEHILVECCRKCSFEYKYKLQNGKFVTILCGRPNPDVGKYKALSYVWEDTRTVLLECRKCLEITGVPMRDERKFRRIMEFLRGDSRVWIDALSINQSDPEDKAAQLPVMGDIYRHADVVSVFLPEADAKAYQMVKSFAIISGEIVKRYDAFAASQTDKELWELAEDYSSSIKACLENLPKWEYWKRAWTFQEWVMASEIELCYEEIPGNEVLSSIKNVIVEASTLLGHWRKTTAKATAVGTEAEKLLRQVHLREDLGSQLNATRALFPFEGMLVADSEKGMDSLRTSTLLTPMPIATDSGTYVSLKKSPPLRPMLGLVLNAMGTNTREATYQADLVACWASACNIKYPYDVNDAFATALHKVIFALRERGIRVYNFLANTDSAETDLEFLKYSAAHLQRNASSGGYLFGAPIFVGRADTVTHVLQLLRQSETLTHLPPKSKVTLQPVSKAVFKRPIPWSNKPRVISAFRAMVSGKADGSRLLDVVSKVDATVDEIDVSQLNKRLLITVSIGADDIYTMWYFNSWAIIPSSTPLRDLFVARESLNGTLVLAIFKAPQRDVQATPYTHENPREPATVAHIVAYLNMTHQRDGTYLIKSDEKGILDIVFRTEDTPEHELWWVPDNVLSEMGGEGLLPDWSIKDALSDRVLGLKMSLEERFFSLVEQKSESKLSVR